jgi:hypothetical protein
MQMALCNESGTLINSEKIRMDTEEKLRAKLLNQLMENLFGT